MTAPIEPFLPTPDDVAAVLRARTRDDTGTELGTWTSATRPTDAEVERLIAMAAGEISDADGPGEMCAGRCRTAVIYRTACLIELSYFPEQVRSDRSPYTELKELADAALEALHTCISSGSADGGVGGVGYSFHSLPIEPAWHDAATGGWRYPEYAATWQNPCQPPTLAQPAEVLIPEPAPLPPIDIVVGYPSEGDPDRGLPPIVHEP
jgi:hypothetical protein